MQFLFLIYSLAHLLCLTYTEKLRGFHFYLLSCGTFYKQIKRNPDWRFLIFLFSSWQRIWAVRATKSTRLTVVSPFPPHLKRFSIRLRAGDCRGHYRLSNSWTHFVTCRVILLEGQHVDTLVIKEWTRWATYISSIANTINQQQNISLICDMHFWTLYVW